MSFLDELKRRNVFRVAIAYIILSWLMAQVAELLLEAFGSPDWVLKTLLALFLVGFPFALFFAWAFEMTPEGLRKEKDVDRSQSITSQTGHKLDRSIIVVLILGLGYFAWDKFLNIPVSSVESSQLVVANADDDTDSNLPTDNSIAVLPFDNRSSQQEDEFFTTGIHDDLLTQLAQISSLRVISRTSVMQFKNTSKSIREIAELLGVATILEGGVQRAGNQVRINMQLIDAATDTHLWAQTYDRELTANNIFTIQSEIATAVTQAMRATLSPADQTRITDVPTQNMEALEEYFKGRAELDQRTLPAIESARMRFERARRLDSGFALALAGEAQTIMFQSDSSYGDIPEIESNAMARPLLERALQRAPNDPQVLAVYGLLEGRDGNISTELDYYARSLALNPSSGEVLNWNRMALARDGQIKESKKMAVRMIEVDPMSMITLFNGIASLTNTPYDDHQRIEKLLQRLYDLDEGYGLSARALVENARGNLPQAVSIYYQVLESDPGRSPNRRSLALSLASIGFGDEAMQVAPDLAYLIYYYNADWQQAIKILRQRYEHDPSTGNTGTLMLALAEAGETETAFSLAQELWSKLGTKPLQLGPMLLKMTWIAMKTEHPKEAAMYREAAGRFVQNVNEAEITSVSRYRSEAALAALDNRQDDALSALSLALDKGMRRHYGLQTFSYQNLRSNPKFQALLNRQRALIESDRGK